jgi:phage recombination protein Bet
MTKEIEVKKTNGLAYTREQIDLIKRTVARGASDDELKLFLHMAKRTGLDPFARQIYCIKRWNSDAGGYVMTTQTGIDGYRLMAERTGRYAPGKDHEFKYDAQGHLVSATARVMKQSGDQWFEITATARFDEYVQKTKDGKPTMIWATKPHIMLGKCAEALALRRAFPQELSGLYVEDEMGDSKEADKEQPESANEILDAHQLKYFHTQITNMKMDKTEVKRYIFDSFGKESSKDLTLDEAQQVLEWVKKQREGK